MIICKVLIYSTYNRTSALDVDAGCDSVLELID